MTCLAIIIIALAAFVLGIYFEQARQRRLRILRLVAVIQATAAPESCGCTIGTDIPEHPGSCWSAKDPKVVEVPPTPENWLNAKRAHDHDPGPRPVKSREG